MGYTTVKVAVSTIHPSKRARHTSEPSTSQTVIFESSDSEEGSSGGEVDPEAVPEDSPTKRATRHSTKSAAKLVSKQSLSTRKASQVLQSLAEDEVSVPTPSQSGVWRRTIRDAEHVKNRLMELISEEKFCLHFDGKKIDNKEYQVVCLKNERTLQLGILTCESGSAADIYIPLQDLLDEYNAWSSIQMIICDTTAVNTGRKSGVVASLQRTFRDKGFNEPQYIGCQHHILDLLLRHVLDFFFPIQSRSPNINYEFIDEILEQYNDLQNAYMGTEVVPEYENLGWRDDCKFLLSFVRHTSFTKRRRNGPTSNGTSCHHFTVPGGTHEEFLPLLHFFFFQIGESS